MTIHIDIDTTDYNTRSGILKDLRSSNIGILGVDWVFSTSRNGGINIMLYNNESYASLSWLLLKFPNVKVSQ